MLIEKDFAGNMVREDSALLQVVMKVLLVLAPPSSIMPNQSVLGNGALQPFEQVEGVASTAVAVKKYARWQVARTSVFKRTVIYTPGGMTLPK